MVVGLIIGSIGFAMLTQLNADSGLPLLVASTVILSLGLAPVFTLTTDMIIGTAPPERAGAAAAISETSGELGGAMGIAVLGSIGTAIYRNQMASGVPEGVSPESSEAARSTLGGAVSVAETLPPDLSVQLLDSARSAFQQSLELTAIFSSLAMLAIAVMVIVVLRDVDTGTGTDDDESMAPAHGRGPVVAEAD
jgi:DHA2 family multidrug resistance protein-like MFS transporter